jgi:O-antigen ligase
MYYYQLDTGLASFIWGPQSGLGTDFFLYYKQLLFITISVVLLIAIIFGIFYAKKPLPIKSPIIFLFLYALLTLLSTIFSEYSHWGYKGLFEQFESVFMIIGYFIVVLYTFLFIKNENDIRLIIKSFTYGLIALSLLGFTQIIGHNFLDTSIGQSFYIPEEFFADGNSVDFNFGANRVFLTLFNPNYVGVYVSMVLPFLISMIITERNKKHFIIYLISIIGMAICLVGSLSATGLFSIIITLVLLICMFRKYIFVKAKMYIIVISILLLSSIIAITIRSDAIMNTAKKIFDINKSNYTLTEINTESTLSITYNNNILNANVYYDNTLLNIQLTDESNSIILYETDSSTGILHIKDSRFENIKITPVNYEDKLCIKVLIDNKEWVFSNQLGDNTFYYLNQYGKFVKIDNIKSSLFAGYESYASGRAYLWSRTIPLLKDYTILGAGADSFVFVFPQQDYVGLSNVGFEGSLVTKPHNLYLQIGVQSGLLSLLCFLLFYGFYFVNSIRLYANGHFTSYSERVGISIFIGTIGYMISGLSNDSSITVSPTFWTLLGLGYSINYHLKQKK